MRPQGLARTAITTARRPATGPVKTAATAPTSAAAQAMTEERRCGASRASKAPGLSKSPGRDLAIGLAFWAGFAVLVLHYLGIVPWGQPTAADIRPPHPPSITSR